MANNDKFSIFFHHGGRFDYVGGEKIYSGGDIKSRHGLDVDRFGFLDLVDEVVKLDGVSWDNLHFKVPETSEFKELHDDTQVMDMISYVLKGSRFISVYVGNERVDGEVIRHMENNLDISTPCDGDYEFSDDSSVEGDDYNDMDESSDEDSDDGLLDVELAADDEEYIQARQNMKKQSTIEGGKTIAHQDALKISRTTGKNILDAKKEGLMNAVSELAPHAEHRNCARHVYCNWKKKFKGPTLNNIFWKAARSTYIEAYKQALEDMKIEDEAAFMDFIERDAHRFCKAFISTQPHCDMVDNNVSETFNGYILTARGMYIIDMLQEIKRQLMRRHYSKLTSISGITDMLCSNVRAKLEQNKYASRLCTAIPTSGSVFEVATRDNQFVVNVEIRTCACKSWDLTGIPCIHACSALDFLKVDPANYVADCYNIQCYREAYKYGLPSTNGPSMWPPTHGFPIKPPHVRKMPGRPRIKRRRAPEEKEEGDWTKRKQSGLIMTCQRCNETGHNKRTCKNPHVERQESGDIQRGGGGRRARGRGRGRANPPPENDRQESGDIQRGGGGRRARGRGRGRANPPPENDRQESGDIQRGGGGRRARGRGRGRANPPPENMSFDRQEYGDAQRGRGRTNLAIREANRERAVVRIRLGVWDSKEVEIFT